MLSRQTLVALAQVLEALSTATRNGLLYKHFGVERNEFKPGLRGTTRMLEVMPDDDLLALLREAVSNSRSIRTDASPRYAFDEPFDDFVRWLLHDGWTVEQGELHRIGAAVEDVVEVRDRFLSELEASGLDAAPEIAELIERSGEDLRTAPPDFNGAGTNARIALETLVRRMAQELAQKSAAEPPRDRWGDALFYLRQSGLLNEDEEDSFAQLYTFVSDAAHVPLSDEEWARLARAFTLSTCYYLLRKWSTRGGA